MGKKDGAWIPCCRCGTEQEAGERVSVVLVLVDREEPLGSLQITHHERECPVCHGRNAWHLRTRSILGMTVRSSTPCRCMGSATRALSPSAADSLP